MNRDFHFTHTVQIYIHLHKAIASFFIPSLVISPLTQRYEICLNSSGKATPSMLLIAFAILTALRRFSLSLSSIETHPSLKIIVIKIARLVKKYIKNRL